MPRAIIFDVDGTLIDSVDHHARAWKDAFLEFGHDIAFDAIRGQIGKGGDQLMPVFLDEAEREAIGERLSSRRGDILKQRYLESIRPFADVRALFERIRKDGTRIALASSAKQDELEVYKQKANIADLIDVATTSEDAERSKPHPDIFQAAIERLEGIAPADMIVVGDTPYDAQAATKAGLRVVGVLCGGFPEADLRKAGCQAIFRDPADMLARYEGSPLAPSA